MIDWFFSAAIGAFRSLPSVVCSFGGPLSYSSPVFVFLNGGHPRVWNFYSTVPVYVIRMKCSVNCLFDHAGVPVRITINKPNLIPKRLVSAVVGVL